MAGLAERLLIGCRARWHSAAARVRDSFRAFWNAAAVIFDASGGQPTPHPPQRALRRQPAHDLPIEQARSGGGGGPAGFVHAGGAAQSRPIIPTTVCSGDRWRRDAAYHQDGLGWLLGPFCETIWRTTADRRTT
jgi:hypothetical protein